jgi:hypothetical protein
VIAQSATSTGWDVVLQAMNIVQTICLTYIAARWGAMERGTGPGPFVRRGGISSPTVEHHDDRPIP